MEIAIVDMVEATVDAAARVAVAAFAATSPGYLPDVASAAEEVREALQAVAESEGVCRVALGDDGAVLGWVAATAGYDGRVWELHPLVVTPSAQGQGVGRALVRDLEREVGARGALTLWLGVDDVLRNTSLTDVDVYGDVPGAIAGFAAAQAHPAGFYLRVGFTVVGVMPDANGLGRHDVLMAKRVG